MNNKLLVFDFVKLAWAIFLSLLIVFVIIIIISNDPLLAIHSFVIGPFTTVRRFGNIIEAMTPLLFTGLSVTMLYKAGLFNLSMEGGFFIGSVGATAAALLLPFPPLVNLLVAMAFAAVLGGIASLIPGILKVKCNANELVTSLMLNFVLLHIGMFIVINYLRDPGMGVNFSHMFPEEMQLTRFVPGTRINTGLLIALAAVVIFWVILNRTSFGYKVSLVGKNAKMAAYSGIAVGKVIVVSQLIGGMAAGLGGATELFGMFQRFQYQGLPGFGWDGVLIAIVAQFKVQFIPPAAFFLAYLRTGADIMARTSDVPMEIIRVIQAVMIVLISAAALLSRYRNKLVAEQAEKEAREDG